MFYQNNNDYMRDAFFYSTPQNSTYQNGCVSGFTSMNNMQTPMVQNSTMPVNTMGNNMMTNQNTSPMMTNQMVNPMMTNQMTNNMMTQQCMQGNSVTTMYPQIYRIINPVASRVISNSNCQCLTEDSLNNMVDTVYNIVEGDVSTLSNTMPTNSGDDTVTQGNSRTTSNSNTNTNTTTNSGTRQTSMSSESSRNSTTTISSQSNRGQNQLLRDLIKIIIIKELLSRQRGFGMDNTFMGQMNNSGFTNNANNFFEPRMYGMM